MRPLCISEVELVSGGGGPLGALIGGAAAGIGTAINGGSPGQIAGSAAMGAAGGFFGGVITQMPSLAAKALVGGQAILYGAASATVN